MPLCVVISSYVAASRVGSVPAAMALGALKIDPLMIPTTLLGRHPGWGPPGGGPVAIETMAAMLDAVDDQGLFAKTDAVLTGYFANAKQVAIAAAAIDAIRAVRPDVRVLVDPVLGDDGALYVAPAVAAAIRDQLVARATVLTPNLFELGWLSAASVATPAEITAAARALAPMVAVTSIRRGDQLGAALITAADAVLATAARQAEAPNGTGDLFAGALLAALVDGRTPAQALAHAVSVCADIAERAARWDAPELPIVAAAASLAAPGALVTLSPFSGNADD